MTDKEGFRFVSLLADELGAKKISLPSLPDVVTRIQSLLEEDSCDFEKVSRLIRVDPILVSRLFVFANSAYHNQTGENTDSLDVAIGRLGFELVRNTAVTLAVEQLLLGEKHKAIAPQLRRIWARSMKLSTMAFALAERRADISSETAYLCGLFHEVGQLYILTKAKDFPEFLGDADSMQAVLDEWRGPTGKSIVEAWGFPESVCASVDLADSFGDRSNYAPTLADVIYVAGLLLDANGAVPADLKTNPYFGRVGVTEESLPEIMQGYSTRLNFAQQSLAVAS